VGQVEVQKDGGEDRRVGQEGKNFHGPTAGRAEERQDFVDTGEEHGPADTRRAGGARRIVQVTGHGVGVSASARLGISAGALLMVTTSEP